MGPQGPQGVPGEGGAADAYSHVSVVPVPIPDTGSQVTVATITLPEAGSYALWPAVTLSNDAGRQGWVMCTLGGAYTGPGAASQANTEVGSNSQAVLLSWTVIVTVAGPESLTVDCASVAGQNTALVAARVEVIGLEVATVTPF